jgi:hypothetical protein
VGLQHRLPAEWPAAESGSTDARFGSACGNADDGRGGGSGKGGPRGDCCGHGSSSSGTGSSEDEDEDEGACEDAALSLPGALAWRALAAVADDEPSEPVGRRPCARCRRPAGLPRANSNRTKAEGAACCCRCPEVHLPRVAVAPALGRVVCCRVVGPPATSAAVLSGTVLLPLPRPFAAAAWEALLRLPAAAAAPSLPLHSSTSPPPWAPPPRLPGVVLVRGDCVAGPGCGDAEASAAWAAGAAESLARGGCGLLVCGGAVPPALAAYCAHLPRRRTSPSSTSTGSSSSTSPGSSSSSSSRAPASPCIAVVPHCPPHLLAALASLVHARVWNDLNDELSLREAGGGGDDDDDGGGDETTADHASSPHFLTDWVLPQVSARVWRGGWASAQRWAESEASAPELGAGDAAPATFVAVSAADVDTAASSSTAAAALASQRRGAACVSVVVCGPTSAQCDEV